MANQLPLKLANGRVKQFATGDTISTTIAPGSGGGGGGLTLTVVEKDLGSSPRYGGTFDIVGTGLTADKPVLVQQAVGPYTGKGNRQDEAEMDQALATGYVVDATTIRVYWQTDTRNGPLVGNVKFQYAVSV